MSTHARSRFSGLSRLILVPMAAILCATATVVSAQEDDDQFDALPPPSFGGSQENFLDLPVEEPPDAGAMEAITLELPDPYFGGTPLDYKSPNLEKPNYKPRPPFMAPAGTSNVAQGKTVSSSAPDPQFGELGFLVDGDTSYEKTSLLGVGPGLQWVQIDLGSAHNLYALALWHFHEGERVYFDIVIRIADDAAFTQNVRTVFNNDHDNSAGLGAGADKEYVEDYKSKFIDLKGVSARCIRFYSNGNTTDDLNHYVEAQVFGKPVN